MPLPRLERARASQFARIALGHVSREYPNKLDHVMGRDADARSPRALHPVFFGSFDWHSCVHGYWTLATVLRLQPSIPEAEAIRQQFRAAFTVENIALERVYLARPESRGFERPYGWAWLLRLQAELLSHDTDDGLEWAARLQPLAEDFAQRFSEFLPKATYPVRAGTHGNTAFALALVHAYALRAYDGPLLRLCEATAQRWYLADEGCQAWEPSGDDFLSSALIEAECLRCYLPGDAFARWFERFLPAVERGQPATLFIPAMVSDRTDGKIAHLDGLNLSRAWCWRAIAGTLGPSHRFHAPALRAASLHLAASLPQVAGDYMGEHWLASFALLALTAGDDDADSAV